MSADAEPSTIKPIDNQPLLKSSSKYIGNHPLLKSKVKVGTDFVLVSEQFWRIILKSFGGGPTLRLCKVSGYPAPTYVYDVSTI